VVRGTLSVRMKLNEVIPICLDISKLIEVNNFLCFFTKHNGHKKKHQKANFD